ncbi:MAG: LysR family transcriptional regulator, partial [Paracoccaceae bacterium]
PVHLVEFEVLYALAQPVHAVFRRNGPLASNMDLRLRDCLEHNLILPARAYGVRHLLEAGGQPSETETESSCRD